MKYKSNILNMNPGLWDINKTLIQNAKKFGIGYDYAYYLAHLNNLQYVSSYVFGPKKIVSIGTKIGRPKKEKEKCYGNEDIKFCWDETLECGGLI